MIDVIKRELCCGAVCNAPAEHLCAKDDVDVGEALDTIKRLTAERDAAVARAERAEGLLREARWYVEGSDPHPLPHVVELLARIDRALKGYVAEHQEAAWRADLEESGEL